MSSSKSISLASLGHLLGISTDTPLVTSGMRKKLAVTFLSGKEDSPRLHCFTQALMHAFKILGIRVLDIAEATDRDGSFKPGIVIIAPGVFPDEQLAINLVPALYGNIILGVHDEEPPLTEHSSPQEKLDRIVEKLAWDMVHLSIYVTGDNWTICTMNGGVVKVEGSCPLPSDVLNILVPKLTAQVIPPDPSDLDHRPGTLQAAVSGMNNIVNDFRECSRLWSGNQHLLTHTSRESLRYRNALYRKIVARYLDNRSGMSYGFFARQMPVAAPSAILLKNGDSMFSEQDLQTSPTLTYDNRVCIPVKVLDQWFLVEPVPVITVTTRSGCRKTQLNPETDLVALSIDKGKITLMTPGCSPDTVEPKPSFDTLTILAHALGNTIVSSILQRIRPSWLFPQQLAQHGASITHWHGFPGDNVTPAGYVTHGENNPPVSCSTPQSAAYSLLGKIDALEKALTMNEEYRGDIHIEPNHGTNIIGTLSLAETAALLNRKTS